jgi:hypothetical protein
MRGVADIILADVTMQPVGEVDIAIAIEIRISVIKDGTGIGQPSTSTDGTSITFSTSQ